ncbi:Polyketide cyclase / dehydrase and lipid transport [Jatrophihabitans endophyticus]|uniref:Polyketide cyclase / dehydrase and lipid transport n=1 Tax=Jatrophihabitans endophyticus TaxID=1206085 RepID=A0A1M5DV79_9ACTN|nr:SRPBCC family protein [Jatrophihabitans endophyticus]SHF70913.1 Polyketide cyclase / dehydrase and lipid transport [Jatrophihabitans endophyticus]
MATNEIEIAVGPDEVFAVLADGWTYTNWVVGTSHMRAVESTWPAPGSRLHHAAGSWPLALRDETEVAELEVGRRLVLIARGRPAGTARIVIELAAVGPSRTHVTMHETPVDGPGRWLHNPVSEAVLVRRNTESLARLAALCERRTSPAE